jgi:acyl carrier protein
MSPNGKLDRKALPAPEGAAFGRGSFEAPRGEMEVRLAAIWAEVLNSPKIGRTDNFFDLGGHSLLAMRLCSRLREAFAMHIPLRWLFEDGSVAAMAEHLEAAQADRDAQKRSRLGAQVSSLSDDEVRALLAKLETSRVGP